MDNHICYICRDTLDISTNISCKPCNCTNLYSHTECFKNWIVIGNQDNCAACGSKYKIKIKKKFRCDWPAIIMSLIWECFLALIILLDRSSVDRIGMFIGMFSILIPWIIFSIREDKKTEVNPLDNVIITSI